MWNLFVFRIIYDENQFTNNTYFVDKNVNTGKFILSTEKEYYYSMERVVTYEKKRGKTNKIHMNNIFCFICYHFIDVVYNMYQ